MSEYLNSKEYKQQVLKDIIKGLHSGKDPEEVKEEFRKLIKDVEASEIANMEQALIEEGMAPQEITRLCDVHAAVFKDALSENEKPELIPGHPLYTLKHENDEAKKTLEKLDELMVKLAENTGSELENLLNQYKERVAFFRVNMDRHYAKKENILFPYLERHNITGPPSVMWSVDDEIRDMIKELSAQVSSLSKDNLSENLTAVESRFETLKHKALEMVFKEENILTPMMLESLTQEEWLEIKEQDVEFGVVFSRPHGDFWQPSGGTTKNISQSPPGDETLPLDTGFLTPQEINTILTNVPIDITYVDKEDTVKYFSQGRERIFTRTRSIIGRKVQNCHPPDSVHIVEKILADFKSGKHNKAEFWLELNGAFIHIRYFALRDTKGEYVGTIEVSQDITRIRALEGERRLLQYED